MTNADRLFIDRIINEGIDNKDNIYKEVYNTNRSKAMATINSPEIKQGIQDVLKRDGITLHKLNKKLKERLESKKVIYYDPKLKKDVVPDNDAQLDALKTGYKLLGALKDKDTIIDNRQVTFTGDIDRLIEVMNESKIARERIATDTTGEVV
jgi:hypothetical protein